MKLVFLVNGKDARDLLLGIPFPESSKHSIGHYGKRDVFVVTVSLDRKTVQSAKILADYRDQLLALEKNKNPKKRSVKCLHDEASEFFCARLYPKFLEFERGLRMAVTIALCADRDSFDNEVAASLEHLTLENLGERLFTEHAFVKDVQRAAKTNYIRKDAFLRRVEKMQEKTMWDGLFGNDMPSVKRLFDEIRNRRNDVMHFHTMSADQYKEALALVGSVNRDLHSYINRSLANVNYPAEKAEGAKRALLELAETYSDIAREYQRSILPMAKMLSGYQDTYSQLMRGLAPYQDQLKRMQESLSSIMPSISPSLYAFDPEISDSLIRSAQAMVDAASKSKSQTSLDTQGHPCTDAPDDGSPDADAGNRGTPTEASPE